MSATAPEVVRSAAMRLHLQTVVPLRMMALAAKGGPDAGDWAATAGYEAVLAARGEDVVFGGGEQTTLIAGLAGAIAVLAWCPGGVTFWGLHFRAGAAPVYGRSDG